MVAILRARQPLAPFVPALLGLTLLAAMLIATGQFGKSDRQSAIMPPAPPSMAIRHIAPAEALRVNAAIPIANGANPAATPFHSSGDASARSQALECLTSAVYYEAGNQGAEGERAVAQVVLNRVRHPAFPTSVCGVVYQGSTMVTGCQFTFTCDGSLNRPPDPVGWRRARQIAAQALNGAVYAPVGWATHYHADYVVPYWSASLAKNAIVGAHIFYHWAGGWGAPAIFRTIYAGHEPNASALKRAALSAVHALPINSASSGSLAGIPGIEILKLTPSMRGDKRVAVRFNQTARAAAESATHEDYVKRFDSSANLRWSLSSDQASSAEAPLGQAPTSSGSSTN